MLFKENTFYRVAKEFEAFNFRFKVNDVVLITRVEEISTDWHLLRRADRAFNVSMIRHDCNLSTYTFTNDMIMYALLEEII